MLPKVQFQAAMARGLSQPAPAAAPVAPSVLTKLLSGTKTAKIAIGSIVAAALVYAGFRFATAPAKKVEAQKAEAQKKEQQTDRVIQKFQEVKAAGAKACRQIATSAANFRKEHPVAFKAMVAAATVGAIGLTAKLLYKPAQVVPVDSTFDNINAGDGSDSRCEEHGASNLKAALFSEGDSELVPEDYDRDHLIPGMEFDAKAANDAKQARFESFYARQPVKAAPPAPALHKAGAERKLAQEAEALAKTYAPDFTGNEGLDEILDAQEQAVKEMAIARDKSWINSFLGFDLEAQIAAEKEAEIAANTLSGVGSTRAFAHVEHDDTLPSLSNPTEDSLESGNSTEGREYPVSFEELLRNEAELQASLDFLSTFSGKESPVTWNAWNTADEV